MNARTQTILLALASTALYVGVLYLTPRADFGLLITQWGTLFLLFWGFTRTDSQFTNRELSIYASLAVFFRLLAVFALPLLSDDYFRFIWDGTLLGAGENPFLQLPATYMADPALAESLGLRSELFEGLNSPEYFTIYPPVLQFIFYVGASLSPDSIYGAVVIMKLFVFAAELGSLWLIYRLLERWQKPLKWFLLYALNPFVIIELTGNLHFEALMIFFLLLTVYWLDQNRLWLSTTALALAVASKLLPLIVLPLMIKRLGWGKAILYGALVGLWTLLMFLPIMDWATFVHIQESIGLYVNVFEFNASIWYLIRGIGYWFVDFNIIRQAGPTLSILVMLSILGYAFAERKTAWQNMPSSILWVYLIYLTGASIVHPWYVSTLVAFGALSRFRFPILWSALVPLTYFAYRNPPAVEESSWILLLEYLPVASLLVYERYLASKKPSTETLS
ncbi:MAG: glycosyltransferase 87 family protein [Bacteroidota bacterium]